MTQPIRNRDNITIGTLVTEGTETVIRDKNGQTLGKYDSKTNITRTVGGATVGTGNQLTSLLPR